MSTAELLTYEDRKLSTLGQRIISCLEMFVAVSIVIAHNVYHSISNEVPILVILAIASFRIREGTWGTHLYRSPKSWRRTLLAALGCFVLLQLKDAILEPIGNHFWPGPIHVSSIVSHSHDLGHALRNLFIVGSLPLSAKKSPTVVIFFGVVSTSSALPDWAPRSRYSSPPSPSVSGTSIKGRPVFWRAQDLV